MNPVQRLIAVFMGGALILALVLGIGITIGIGIVQRGLLKNERLETGVVYIPGPGPTTTICEAK